MTIAFVTKYNPTTNPGTATAISLSVTVAVGDYIVLAVAGGLPATVGTAPAGGGLTYTQRVAQNPGGNLPCTYMWTATSASAQTFTLTVTMSGSTNYSTTVSRYSGVGSIGGTGTAHGADATGGLPSTTVTTTAANSVVVASSADWVPATGAATWVTTSGTPTTIGDTIASGSLAAHDAYYTIATTGSKTIGESAPTNQVWTIGAVELVAGSGSTLTNTVAPAVTPAGTQAAGTVLSTDNGTWSATPDSFTYQWNRDGSAIGSATSSSYTTANADIGHTITCVVTAIKASFTNGTATSNGVSIVAPVPQPPPFSQVARKMASSW